jgi:hypothetical protein
LTILNLLDAVGAELLAFGHAILRLDAVRPRLLALDHSVLRLDAIVPNLLALNASLTFDPRLPLNARHAFDASWTLDASLALKPLRPLAFNCKSLLTLHPLGSGESTAATAALNVERLPWHRTALGRLGTLGALRRGPLTLNLVGIAVITARASRGRRGNRQRRDAGSEE